MRRRNIIYHSPDLMTKSLREVPLIEDCEGRIEYLFYAVTVARDFDDLKDQLSRILAVDFVEVRRSKLSVTYELQSADGEINYLRFIVKEND